MPLLFRNSSFARVTAIAGLRAVHSAFAWMHGHPRHIMNWHKSLVAIPAPPFGERARAEWLAERFQEIGLGEVHIDDAGNVFGTISAANLPPESTGPVVVLSAHIDTVFPANTPINLIVDGDQIAAPGVCDNGAGVAGLLAIAQALVHANAQLPTPLILLGNVGEEGEGDLRGVRQLYERNPLAGRIAAHIILDGAGSDSAVTHALGSQRFRVEIKGPGGHSFTDAGTPNPIIALATALATLAKTTLPEEPRTTLNIGTIQGGTSVNSIPESAQASVDFRSTDHNQLLRLEVALHRAVEDAVDQTNARPRSLQAQARGGVTYTIEKIGDRPASHLPADSPLLEALRAVDRHLRLQTDLRLGSTDANIPLSLGIPALSLGAGGDGGGAHTQAEWYSAANREIGLKRVLLLTLAMADWAAAQ